ncbi:glycosyltransferase [Thermanaerovibrio velox]|uniref:glycosyltransferase n=1 Tax=Thermanaerovibrio velox TaxID=108007 RepID=UPI0002F07246|nr:glycosyltransferase [Thermanaerovibrio velox]
MALTIESFLIPYAEELRRRGWTVCTAAQGAMKSPTIRDAFDAVFDVPFARNPLAMRNLRAGFLMRGITRSRSFSLIHVHTPVASFVTRLALGPMRNRGREKGVKILYTAHGFHFHPHGKPVTNFIFETLERVGSPFTDVLFVMNRYDLARAREMRLAPRIEFVPGVGVDLSFFDPPAVGADEVSCLLGELGIPGGLPYFVYVAEFNPGKRHSDLVEAMGLVRRDCCVVLVGDGRLRSNVEAMVSQAGLAHRFRFAGFRRREEVRALLKGSSGLLFPSSREGLPRSVIEAMAMGKLVIGADSRGTVDLLEEGRGWLYPVGDVPELARLIERALDEPREAQEAGEAARDYVVRNMDVRKLVSSYADLCESLI